MIIKSFVTKLITNLLAGLFVIIVCLLASVVSVSLVDALQSAHFQFNETSLGGIGVADTSSTNFKASTSGAILGFDNSADGIMQVNNGHETTNDPALSFAVDFSNINFGSFSPTLAAVTTSNFEVADYTSYGYIVQTFGTPPTNGTHTITAMSSTGVSTVGVEQFGINLVANTSPSSFGANPDHGQFGFGSATSNYGTSDNYRFVSGEIIASAPKSSGTTRYTISYIVNVDSLTPGGQYNGDQTILCTATY